MEKRFYLDTAIWMDYFENRGNGIKPLGEFAFLFLKKCEREGARVIVSDKVTEELEAYYSEQQIRLMLSSFGGVLVKVNHTEKQAREAFALLKKFKREIPFADILHSIIARDESAVLVTRDRHFESIGSAKVRSPEELL